MVKKSLIAISVLAMAVPAIAGSIKVHTPWPVKYVPQEITTIDVTLDVGFFIHIKDQKPIKVYQDPTAANPFQTYKGCKTTGITSNFEAQVHGKVSATSPAGGSWNATIDGSEEAHVHPGNSHGFEICVMGSNVKIDKLQGGSRDVKVAELTMMVLPES